MKISRILLILSGAMYLAPFGSMRADVLDHWHWRNPAPFSDYLRSVAYGNGKYVAVGEYGVMFVSPDTINWNDGSRVVKQTLNQIAFLNSQFFAVGNSGVILSSSNGLSWVQQPSGTSNSLFGVAYGNGIYVACGAGGQLAISPNGTSWTPANVGTNDLSWITFDNGIFLTPLLTGTAPSLGLAVRISSDGLNWTTGTLLPPTPVQTIYNPRLGEVKYGNGTFVAATIIEEQVSPGFYQPALRYFTSPDGLNWSKGAKVATFFSNPGVRAPFVEFVNNQFYTFALKDQTVNANLMAITTNGSSSDFTAYTPADTFDSTDFAHANGQFLFVGPSGKVWNSPDAIAWTPRYSGTHNAFGQIIKGGLGYLLVGYGEIQTSADGISFTPISGTSDGYWAVAHDGSNYVAVADGGHLYTSTNGLNWVPRTSNSDQTLKAVCRGATRWVAVGEGGRLVTSPNSLSWSLRTSGTPNHLNGVAFGTGVFVAVGDGGVITMSSDGGVSWDVQFSGTSNLLAGVKYVGDRFIAVGNYGTILSSVDGAEWDILSTGTDYMLTDVVLSEGRYVVGGWGSLLQSTNGTTWEDISLKLPSARRFYHLSNLDQSYWLTGEEGSLLQTDSTDGRPRLAGTLLPNQGGFQIKVVQNAPANYRIQASTSSTLTGWQDAAAFTNAVAPHVWTDGGAAINPLKVYRLVSP